MTKFRRVLLAPFIFVAMTSGFAADKDALVGSWRLVSFEREYQATGEREYPMGKAPSCLSCS